jgi:hypothetical protein
MWIEAVQRRAQSAGAIAVLAGTATFIAVVISLHLLQPDYDSVHQLMSELALGRYGEAMLLAFGGLATAMLGVQAAISPFGASRPFRVLLAIAALFFLAAGLFPLGATSELHIVSIAIAFVLSVLAMYFYPSAAGVAASAAPRVVSWSLAGAVALSVALGQSVLPMGVSQRLGAGFLLAWLLLLGFRLRRIQLNSGPTARE